MKQLLLSLDNSLNSQNTGAFTLTTFNDAKRMQEAWNCTNSFEVKNKDEKQRKWSKGSDG